MILTNFTYVKENLTITKKVTITKIFKKLNIMIAALVYIEAQHIQYVISNILRKEIYQL